VASDDPDESSVSVALAGTARPAAVGSFPAPTDPDGDCRYENVNGQNGFDVVDVQALFANRESLETRSDRAAFNFNGDTDDQGDPIVDVVDASGCSSRSASPEQRACMTTRIGSAAGAGPDRHPRRGWGRHEFGPTAVMAQPAAGRTHGLWEKIPREDGRLPPGALVARASTER